MAAAYLSTKPIRISSSSRTLVRLATQRAPAPVSPMFFHSGLFSSSAHHHAPPRDPEFRVLTKQTLNKHVLEAQYAVRGAIPLRAEELREQLENGEGSDLPFNEVVSCNIGNPQQLDQKPLTFLRQISALTEYPALLDHPAAASIFPKDAVERARNLLNEIGSTGAYSHSMGVPAIRKRIANFIAERDGHPADPSKIYITAGASVGVSNLLQALISSPLDGVLIPIPQYPLYTAALALNAARPVPYYLNESAEWGLDIEDLRKNVEKARHDGTVLKGLVVINPGNPTGNCLTLEDMQDIIKLCYEERLVLMADEVYQDNIYHPGKPFISFKKALRDLPSPYAENVELVSFHSISKGQSGECGRRGGYFELTNFHSEAEEQIYKLASIQLCPSLGGQIGVDVLVSPPKEGDESYPLWKEEKDGIAETLKRRSEVLVKAFRQLEGVTCNEAHGAMYLFPQITIPKKAIAEAKSKSLSPDAFYCLQLLEETGITCVPGSGFGQEPGTWHLRTTFLAPTSGDFVERLQKFHQGFMNKYRE
ncbi:pyridoxal phosphate-dependent aminotransferase [Sporobolomyces koalae]|uniref:pyridoxal phosphate-dependent aminotransferase n=1 Tax=Sporobolomyces koalae TaxID=500713 RepID=UPI0031794998